MKPHTPVLLEPILSIFATLHYFLDGTLGAGGHSLALLQAHEELEHLWGCDQDAQALALAAETLKPFSHKVSLEKINFRHLDALETPPLDGILLDIGVSSMQLDERQRGFSFLGEGPLDMRMDRDIPCDAAHMVNTLSAEKLGLIFRELGEERKWRAAAKAIVEGRRKKRIVTTADLCTVLHPVFPRRGKLHPMTKIFQALRIYVNDELGALTAVLPKAVAKLATGGKLAVITFHSLEDRIVKHTFLQMAREGEVTLVVKKPIIASREEMRKNPRSRSAKLRVVEKV